MSNTIKIKRSTGSSAPNPNLRQGEMAYAEGSKALYIGAGTEGSAPNFSASSMHIIGGAINNLIAPTGSLSMNSQKITNLADPTSITDAANKRYVDSHVQGLDVKESVRVATTTVMPSGFPNSYGGSTSGGQNVIDGVTLADGDRVLVKNQTTGSQNGIYVAGSSPVRSADANTSSEVTSGLFVFVEEGTANADNGYVLTTNDTITLDSTALTFTQFSGAGAVEAGNGLSRSGTTISANIDDKTLQISSDTIRIKGITQTAVGDLLIGAASNGGYTRLAKPASNNALLTMGTSGSASWTTTIDGGTF